MADIDADKLVENIEKFGSAGGDPDAEPTPQETAAPGQEAQTPAAVQNPYSFKSQEDFLKHQMEYTANGKQVKEDLQTILKRASQGYNYAQSMNQLNGERSQWETKLKTAEELQSKWGPYDEYAQKNPEWYSHWQSAWQNRGQNVAEPQGSEGNIDQRVNALLAEKLQPFQQMLNEQENRKIQEQVQGEDRELESQVKSIREKYSDIDFDATDPENGKSLELKVLEFGVKNNIKAFDTAFKAFYHDQLVKREVERSKADWSKEKQTNTKAGLVEPKITGKNAQPNLKGMNWDQVAQMAAKQFGIN